MPKCFLRKSDRNIESQADTPTDGNTVGLTDLQVGQQTESLTGTRNHITRYLRVMKCEKKCNDRKTFNDDINEIERAIHQLNPSRSY